MAKTKKEINNPVLRKLIENLGDNVYSLRTKKKMTQLKLASEAGMAISTVLNIEKKTITNVRLETIVEIADRLGVGDPLDLLKPHKK